MSFKTFDKVDVIFFVVVLMISFIAETSSKNAISTVISTVPSTITSTITVTPANKTNSTFSPPEGNKHDSILINLEPHKDMLLRILYVLIAVTTIVIICFGIKAWRAHRRKSKARKYGIITKGTDLEMEPLDKGDDDEEDMTVFEINNKNKKK